MNIKCMYKRNGAESESEWFTGDTPNGQYFTGRGGVRQEGNYSLTLTRVASLDTQSSDISAVKIKESGRFFLVG